MKNRLLPLFFVLGAYSAYSQVGIGTKNPNSSAQLEITTTESDKYGGSTKGLLIPRVRLTSTVIYAPITGTEANSLLVFATEAIGDITPGYYFWLDHKWNRLGTSSDGKDGIAGGTGAPGTGITKGCF